MNIPEELLCHYTISYFNIDKALYILPFIIHKHQRHHIKYLLSKFNIIVRFMKKVYFNCYKNIYNKKLSSFLSKEEEWLTEIIISEPSLNLYMRDLQSMLAYEFPIYHCLIEDFYIHKKSYTMKNVKKTKIIIGPSIKNWDNSFERFHCRLLSRICTPTTIHRIYPVKFAFARKIEKSTTLKALLF